MATLLEPRPIDIKSGWKHNSKILAEIVAEMNEDEYIEDENEMMEIVDKVIEFLERKYVITEHAC
jgi:predicted house-cleaning noncanonical NTP pyrophosphatase (MazG superfamily)